MKKYFISTFFVFLGLLILSFSFEMANAYIPYVPYSMAKSITTYVNKSFGFGGKIIQTKAVEIQTLESTGFTCAVPGKTITISPVGNYPTSYLIPYGVTSKTKNPLGKNRWILGVYKGLKTTITCTNESTGVTMQILLNPITLYGTS